MWQTYTKMQGPAGPWGAVHRYVTGSLIRWMEHLSNNKPGMEADSDLSRICDPHGLSKNTPSN